MHDAIYSKPKFFEMQFLAEYKWCSSVYNQSINYPEHDQISNKDGRERTDSKDARTRAFYKDDYPNRKESQVSCCFLNTHFINLETVLCPNYKGHMTCMYNKKSKKVPC